MRIGVTGGTGFLGRHLVAEALGAGHQVRLLSRRGGDVPGADTVGGDILDPRACRGLAEGCDAIIHAAGLVRSSDQIALQATNVQGTRNVAEAAAAAGVRRVVHISSTGVHGHPGGTIREDGPLSPEHPYEESKARAEEVVLRGSNGPELVVVRPSNVIGADHPRRPLLRLMRRIAAGKTIPEGGAWTNYVGVQDVARATLASLRDDAPPFLIVNAPMTLAGLVNEVSTVLGRRSSTMAIPDTLASSLRPLARHLARRYRPAERLRAIFDDTVFRSRHELWLAATAGGLSLAPVLDDMCRAYRARGLL